VLRPPAPYRGHLSDDVLWRDAAWLYYYEQMGFQRIARWLRANRASEVAGFANENSLLNSLYHAFKKLGWPRRDRIEATNIASYRHGLAPREGRNHTDYQRHKRKVKGARPRCKGIVKGKARAGARCARPAKHGSDFCPGHDPEVRAQLLERVAAMRLISHELVNVWPFTEWLRERRVEFSSNKAMAKRLGCSQTAIAKWLDGHAATCRR
jgi:hypothetical protein